jgi:hypothetical protein
MGSIPLALSYLAVGFDIFDRDAVFARRIETVVAIIYPQFAVDQPGHGHGVFLKPPILEQGLFKAPCPSYFPVKQRQHELAIIVRFQNSCHRSSPLVFSPYD